MPYPIPTMETVRSGILADWSNEDDEITVDEDSDYYIRATGIASAIIGLYQYAKWGINQWFPDTADIENLVRFASARGITQKSASSAIGTVQFTGTPTSTIDAGTIFQIGDGTQYQTSLAAAIDVNNQITVTATAVVAGIGGNLADNTAATLQSAPSGVAPAAIILQMSGGVAAETDVAFLERVLDYLRNPPAGGTKNDFERWAKECGGVTSAYCYPKRRGTGTTDVAILSNGAPPSDALRALVFAYIDNLKTTFGDCMILAPQQTAVAIAGTLTLNGTDLDTALAAIQTSLAEYFAALAPGDTVYLKRIITIILNVTGVEDVVLTLPAGNVTNIVDISNVQQSILGTITLVESS